MDDTTSPAKEGIWIEKYRPRSLSQIVGQEAITSRLKGYVEKKDLPHLLFSGPAGVGKTTSSVAIAQEIYGEKWKENFLELNASDERGIDVVRNRIKNFARSSFGKYDYKIIFLDEADSLTKDAQSALRRTMEQFSHNTRFILSCNYSNRIIDPIQSRCAVFRFPPLSDEAISEKVREIAGEEGITITEGGVGAIIYVSQGDMRKAINSLQAASITGEEVEEDGVYKTAASARPEDIHSMVEKALSGDFIEARKILEILLIEGGVSGGDIIDQIYRSVWEFQVNNENAVLMIDRIGEAEYRISEGASERIQLEALLAAISMKS
ncbi:MAG TPA: replication factor C small subunit [Halobacteriales archaeon]|uniref:replication factor C small subunit n=1 Tax=Candidatus Hikarchaeum yamanae TaxID=2675326 RepID=UPI00182A8E67|nr:replication factor C small subunit [Halobacteriales archaeon]|tara:strand:- start:66284 stop:67252 length:969 start_codon:yes stop_codon:yes gene_type:complete